MKRLYCDIKDCRKEFAAALRSPFFDRFPIVIKIEAFERLPSGQPGRPIDICWDCIIQALTERDTISNMTDPPPGPPPGPPSPPVTKP